MFITNSFSLSWRSSDSFRSSWAWCSLASTSCCCRSFCFTTLSMCWKGFTNIFWTAFKNMVIWQVYVFQKQPPVPPLAVYTAHKASSAFPPARRSHVGGWRCAHCAVPSESGCRSVWTENGLWLLSFSPPPDVFFAHLHPVEGKSNTKKLEATGEGTVLMGRVCIKNPRGGLHLERTVVSLQLPAQTLQLAASQDGLAVLIPEVVFVLD